MSDGTASDLRQRFEAVVDESSNAAAIGDALFDIVEVLSTRPAVRRALVDAGRPAESREALARRLFDGKVVTGAVDVVAAAVQQRWARPSEFTAALAGLGVQAHLAAAESNERLGAVEDEVFRFGRTLRSESALRSALTDSAAPEGSKRQLIHRLLDGKAQPETIRLVDYAVNNRPAGSLENQLERITEQAAARGMRRVAIVHVAVPLNSDHAERLRRALSAQAGTPVQLNVVVEPGLVGGIKVELGDDVIDGTIAARLGEAHRRLAAGRS